MVQDCFVALQQPRRPWLDAEALHEQFLRLSAELHPDRVHSRPAPEREEATRHYAELNAAYQCLRSPKERAQHLLALESGRKPAGVDQVPSEAMDLWFQGGQLCRDADRFLAQRATVTSPLLRVQLFEQGMAWRDRVDALLGVLRSRQEEVNGQLVALNPAWETAPAPGNPERPNHLPLARLELAYRTLSYLAKCTAQLQERLVQLSC